MDEPARRRLLDVLRRATDEDPAARYASVIEFWSELAQVASVCEEKKADETPDDADDTTIIRPRLNVTPVALPIGPAQPDFDPALVTAPLQANFATATLVEKPRAVQPAPVQFTFEDNELRQTQPAQKTMPGDRSSKFFIELQEKRPAPAVQSKVGGEPPAALVDSKSPAKVESPTKTETPTPGRAKKAVDKFNWKVRRKIFIGLMIFTIVGAIVKVDRYVRSQNAPLGFGPPTKIEVVVDGLNVRYTPSGALEKEKVLGTVGKGSVHEVLGQANNKWLKIRISEWAKKEPNVDTDSGWIYGDLDGNPPNVRVVSRKFWR
jgi:hypothetical protein